MRIPMLVLAVLLVGATADAQRVDPDDSLALYFGPGIGYTSVIYGAEPARGSNYVHYDDDGLALRVTIANHSRRLLTAKTSTSASDDAIGVELVKIDGANRTSEPALLHLGADFSLVSGASSVPGVWGSDVPIQPSGYLDTSARAQFSRRLDPGQYELSMRTMRIDCEPACTIRNQAGSYRFEVRKAEGIPDGLDRYLRRATGLISVGEFNDVDALTDRALALYPHASGAHQVGGQKAEALARRAEGSGMKGEALRQWTNAAEAYERALRLLESGQDALRPRGRPALDDDDPVNYLQRAAMNARERAKAPR